MVFTFVKPPIDEISNSNTKVLSTVEEKEHIFDEASIDYLIEYPFTNEIRHLSAVTFIEELVEKLNVKAIIVGDDFHFGYQRLGDYKLLQKEAKRLGYSVTVVKKKQYKGQDISSTFIRELIVNGQLELANHLLGYTYFIQGKVCTGNRIGRTIGFPTVNLIPIKEKILPPYGVYAVRVQFMQQMYQGIANIGVKPTVGEHNPVGIETHIFNFHQEIYGNEIQVFLEKQIRPEMKFDSLDEMKHQIQKDMELVKEYFHIAKE